MDFGLFVERYFPRHEINILLNSTSLYDRYAYLTKNNAIVISTDNEDMVYLFKRSLNDPSVVISAKHRKIGEAPFVKPDSTKAILNLYEYIASYYDASQNSFIKSVIPPIKHKQYVTQLLQKPMIVLVGHDDIHRIYLFNEVINRDGQSKKSLGWLSSAKEAIKKITSLNGDKQKEKAHVNYKTYARKPRLHFDPNSKGEKAYSLIKNIFPIHQRNINSKFNELIIPSYLKKTKILHNFIPWLYLNGIPSDKYLESIKTISNDNDIEMSSKDVSLLIDYWKEDYVSWLEQSLINHHYKYIWADSVDINTGNNNFLSLLIIVGMNNRGDKKIISITKGNPKSLSHWRDSLSDLKKQGLLSPDLAIAQQGIGVWLALESIWPKTKHQWCWGRNKEEIIGKVKVKSKPAVRRQLSDIYKAKTLTESQKQIDIFCSSFDEEYPSLSDSLTDKKEKLLAFHNFPSKHHPQINNVRFIKNTFKTIAGCVEDKRKDEILLMAFQLVKTAQKKWSNLA
jgi:transposase-like protein